MVNASAEECRAAQLAHSVIYANALVDGIKFVSMDVCGQSARIACAPQSQLGLKANMLKKSSLPRPIGPISGLVGDHLCGMLKTIQNAPLVFIAHIWPKLAMLEKEPTWKVRIAISLEPASLD